MHLGLCRSGDSEKNRKKATPVSPEPSGAKKVGDGMVAIILSCTLRRRMISLGSRIAFLSTILDSTRFGFCILLLAVSSVFLVE